MRQLPRNCFRLTCAATRRSLPMPLKHCLQILSIILMVTALAAKPGVQAAIIHDIRPSEHGWRVQLDFVEMRDCHCDAGYEIVNKNTKLRTYQIDTAAFIWLLKNAGEYLQATPQDLIAGRKGKKLGWPFDEKTPFEFRFDAENKRVLEMRQVYLP